LGAAHPDQAIHALRVEHLDRPLEEQHIRRMNNIEQDSQF
jgi:hypothetical protein